MTNRKILILLFLFIFGISFFIFKEDFVHEKDKFSSITKEDWQVLLLNIKDALLSKRKIELPIDQKWNEPSVVFVTTSDGKGPAIVKIGKGDNLIDAFNQAIRKFEKTESVKLIKIDIVNQIRIAGRFSYMSKIQMPFEKTLWGVSLDESFTLAFLPQMSAARSFINNSQTLDIVKIGQYATHDNELNETFKKFIQTKDKTVYQFNTLSFLINGNEVVKLYRGGHIKPKLTEKTLTDAVNSAGVYFTNAVKKNGKFNYSYRPKSDKLSKKYNMLRHAGTVYSMMEIYEFNKDPKLLEAGKKAMNYLIDYFKPCPNGNLCFSDDNHYKLGGQGLSIVALAKYSEATNDMQYLPIMKKLCVQLLDSQNDKGRFIIEKMSLIDGKIENFDSLYYPGEAMLGLLRMYKVDKDPRWLEAVIKGLDWIVDVRDYYKTIPDHWVLYCIGEVYEYHKSKNHVKHARKIIQSFINEQHTYPIEPDWFGGYYSPPRSTPTATRSEGSLATYKLFRDSGDTEFAEKILKTTSNAIQFQLINQFNDGNIIYLKKPMKAKGGWRRSLTNYEIRIDYVQHNVSSILQYLKILKQKHTQ